MSVACHEREEAPPRQKSVCMYARMYVGKSTRAPRRGVLCIYVLQEPRDGTARHTEDKARKKVWRCFMMALSCMQRTICVTAKSRIESYVDLKGSRLPQQTDTQCPVTTDAVSQQPILNTSICTAEPVSAADDLQLLGEEAVKQAPPYRGR